MYNVYLICATLGDDRLYKIGFTKRDVNKRIKEMKTGNAANFQIVDSYNSNWGPKIESVLKKFFKYKNIDGEWFELDENDILDFKKKCEELNDKFNFLSKNNSIWREKYN